MAEDPGPSNPPPPQLSPPSPSSLRSSFSRSFSVEHKAFTVEHKGNTIRVSEKRDRQQSYALFPASMGEWFAATAETASSKVDGFLDKQSEGDLSIYASKKKNTKGFFLTFMVVSPRIKAGAKFIVCPKGHEAIGWLKLADAVRSVATHALGPGVDTNAVTGAVSSSHPQSQDDTFAPPPQPSTRQQRPAPAPHRVAQHKIRRDTGATQMEVRITQGTCTIDQLPQRINNLIRLSSIPTIKPTGDPQLFILHLGNEKDVGILGEIASLKLHHCSLEFSMIQIPPLVSPPSWSLTATREIQLWGLPEESRNLDTLKSFTQDFGILKTFTTLKQKVAGKEVVKITIDNCDLSKITQTKFMGDGDDKVSIRIIPMRDRRPRPTFPNQSLAQSDFIPTDNVGEAAGSDNIVVTGQVDSTPVVHPQQPLQTPPVPDKPRHKAVLVPPSPSPPLIFHTPLSPARPPHASPSYAQVVAHGATLSTSASTPLDRTECSCSRINDLNLPPSDSPPSNQNQTVIDGLIEVGDILGYSDTEKQTMVNWSIAKLG